MFDDLDRKDLDLQCCSAGIYLHFFVKSRLIIRYVIFNIYFTTETSDLIKDVSLSVARLSA